MRSTAVTLVYFLMGSKTKEKYEVWFAVLEKMNAFLDAHEVTNGLTIDTNKALKSNIPNSNIKCYFFTSENDIG